MSSQVRQAAVQIRADYARFGGEPLPDDMGPAEILLERIRVMAGYVRWLDSKIQTWPDELVKLGHTNIDNKGGMQAFPTEKAGWLHEWHTSNDALVNYVKIAMAANIDERRVALAEKEGDTIMRILEQTFDQLQLTQDQLRLIPTIMPQILRGEVTRSVTTDAGAGAAS